MNQAITQVFSPKSQRFLLRFLAIMAVCLLASGCSYDDVFGSESVPEPVGIGRDRNDLKRSPCACIEIEQDYSNWTKG